MRSYEKLSRLLSPHHPVVFLFHGVSRERTSGVRNYTGKHIAREDFLTILQDLRSSGTSCSVADVAAFVRGECALPPRSFAFTFDDGFRNNLDVAAPLLDDFHLHASFYIVTDFLGVEAMTWADRIESAIAETDAHLIVLPFLNPSTLRLRNADERIQAATAIRAYVKSSPSVDHDAFADDVCLQLGVPNPPLLEGIDHKLTGDQARQLDSHKLFSVGSHSKSHAILARLPKHLLEMEIDESCQALSRVLGRAVNEFAYPEGFTGSFSPAAVRRLRENGIVSAVTTIPGPNSVGIDPLKIHRVFVA